MRNKRSKTFVSIFKWHFLNDWIFFGCHAEVITIWKNLTYSHDEIRHTSYKFKNWKGKKLWIMKNTINCGEITRLCKIVEVLFWYLVLFKYHIGSISLTVGMIRNIWNSSIWIQLEYILIEREFTQVQVWIEQCSGKVFKYIMVKSYEHFTEVPKRTSIVTVLLFLDIIIKINQKM